MVKNCCQKDEMISKASPDIYVSGLRGCYLTVRLSSNGGPQAPSSRLESMQLTPGDIWRMLDDFLGVPEKTEMNHDFSCSAGVVGVTT